MAKSKKSSTRKKSPSRKKIHRSKKNQSLLPAMIFLGIAAGLIAVLYIFVGQTPVTGPAFHQQTTSKSLPNQPLPAKAATEKVKHEKRKAGGKTATTRSNLVIYRLANDFSRTSMITIPCDPDLTNNEKARHIIRYLTLPGEHDQPPLPQATRLRAVSFTTPLITIDLSHDLRNGLINSGANDEILTVACLTNSLLASFPGFKALQILIEGKKQKTLAGHIDISRPLTYQSETK